VHYIRQVKVMADTLWEGHKLLKTGLSAHCAQTDRQTDKSEKQYIRQCHSVHLSDIIQEAQLKQGLADRTAKTAVSAAI